MNNVLTYNTIGEAQDGSDIILDIASALTSEHTGEDIMGKIIEKVSMPNTTLFIPATPSALGTGDVASNFRYKHYKDINNNVIERWLEVFEKYSKNKNPVVITSVGRDARYMTFKLVEDGTIKIVNNQTDNKLFVRETKIFKDFIESFGITSENMKKMRISSEGARFNTYMADMIGFINIMNYKYNPEMFRKSHMEPYLVTPESTYYRKEVEGQLMLKPVVINGREWIPKEGFNYMYFRKQDKLTQHMNTFYMFNEDYMPIVYEKMFNMLTLENNMTKTNVRKFMKNIQSYDRLSDFWVNDIDDAFTILMILNCYKYCELDEIDSGIVKDLENIAEPWFKEM